MTKHPAKGFVITHKEEESMKTKFAFTLSIIALAFVFGVLFFISFLNAGDEAHKHEQPGHETHHAAEDKVRCAFDGMMMKASAMTKITHKGKTFYFCNQKQADMFKANPKKYLKQIPLGHLTFNLNVLSVDEYKEMMTDMGMGSMIKMDAMKGKTHHISVYLTQHNQDIKLDDVELALQITNDSGKATTVPLKYNKMMKTYDAYVAMPSGGKYKIQVIITTSEVSVSL